MFNDANQDVATLHVWESVEEFLRVCPDGDRRTAVENAVGLVDSIMSRECDTKQLREEAEKAFTHFRRTRSV